MKKNVIPFSLIIALACFAVIAKAQPQIIVAIDTAYAHTGKIEFPLSKFGDEITDFYGIFPDPHDSAIVTICGKVGTSDPKIQKVGLVQLTAKGTFDSSFGTAGKTVISRGVSDYPNSMFVTSDTNFFLAGATGQSADDDLIPAIFKFNKHGFPDSSFGGDGHIGIRYDSSSRGEFTMVTSVSTKFLAAGRIMAYSLNGHNGFCAMRFLANGALDSSYGNNGKALIDANVHSVFAFLTQNASLTFIGVANASDSEPPVILPLVLGRLTSNGHPDSSFGTNGILRTDNLVHESFGSLVAAIQPDYKIVAAIPPSGVAGLMPVTLVRFTAAGLIDSTYGINGFTTVAFTTGQSRARGINIAKNAKTVIAGSAVGTLENCATSRNNLDGTPDLTLNRTGTAVIDVDSGRYSNSLIRFVGIGNKRYIGVGSSVHNGVSQFLIARFKDDTLSTGAVSGDGIQSKLFSIFPNPVTSECTVEGLPEGLQDMRIVDVMGREVGLGNNRNSIPMGQSYTFDASGLKNGIYYFIVQVKGQRLIQKFFVLH